MHALLLQQQGENDVEEAVSSAFSWIAALQYGVLVVTLLTGLLLLGRALNKRIKDEAEKAADAAKQTHAAIATSNGHSAGQVIEQIPHTLHELKEIACANRDLAQQAVKLAQQAVKLGLQNRDDLQEHKVVGHPAPPGRTDD